MNQKIKDTLTMTVVLSGLGFVPISASSAKVGQILFSENVLSVDMSDSNGQLDHPLLSDANRIYARDLLGGLIERQSGQPVEIGKQDTKLENKITELPSIHTLAPETPNSQVGWEGREQPTVSEDIVSENIAFQGMVSENMVDDIDVLEDARDSVANRRTGVDDPIVPPIYEVQRQIEIQRDEDDNIIINTSYGSDVLDTQALLPVGICSPEALAVGIRHYKYADADPEDLAKVGSRLLHKDAVSALSEMRKAAKSDGVTLTVGSAYRSSTYQNKIIARKKRQKQTDLQIYSVSAPAGYSEHHTGYAVDFTPIDNNFSKSRAYKWLKENAKVYGWEQSFTEDVAARDNVMVESWHWRFIGSAQAQDLFAHQPCELPEVADPELDVEDNQQDSHNIATEIID